MKKANLAISVAQTTSLYGRLDENIRQTVLDTRVAAAKGARVVFFPELSLVGYDLSALADPRLWVEERDARLEPLRFIARAEDIHICVGASVVMSDGRRMLATVVIEPNGEEWIHGKQFLHGEEFDWFETAQTPTTLLVVDGWNIALAVCFDVAVPGHAANAAHKPMCTPRLRCMSRVKFDGWIFTSHRRPWTIDASPCWRTMRGQLP